MREFHPIEPIYDKNSRVLILGSFPSVKSREQGFFYGHPQNRFWKVTSTVFGAEMPKTIEQKKDFLLGNNIALWDVIASCDITGSADSTISSVIPNDLTPIITSCPNIVIFTNGKTADAYYRRFLQDITGRIAVCLPSTSPANAAWSLERLTDAWRIIKI